MIRSKDLYEEIASLIELVNDQSYDKMQRANLKAQLLIIKLLLGIRSNQVTDLKARNVKVGINKPEDTVQVRT